MKNTIVLFAFAILFSCQKSKVKEEIATSFYVGTYTQKESKGIYKYSLSSEGKLKKIGLVAEVLNPSFLTKSNDGKTLFAVGETDDNGTGFISSYTITKDSLTLLKKQITGGANPCFVAINDENYVLAANYSGGNVGLLKATENGELSALLNVQQHVGKGTTDRQTTPHAHSAWFHPIRDEVISVDLGTNQLWFSIIDTVKDELVFTNQKTLKMADGAGPRHLTFHPNNKWIYVLNELNNTVSLVKEKDDTYFVESSISTLPEDFTEFSGAADIHIPKDGKFLYASNRGHESIAIFKVNPENGALTIVAYQSVLGKHPRNFSFSPDEKFILVANKDTDNIVSFKRDAKTGKLTFVSEVAVSLPVCVLF
ncbi:MAG: lactonase family protein [Polaribacter sp.]|uniref:lactonase family protein n=1 Tax=Polaribacter sp. TaxID=1920175 RepID=UPI002F357C0B